MLHFEKSSNMIKIWQTFLKLLPSTQWSLTKTVNPSFGYPNPSLITTWTSKTIADYPSFKLLFVSGPLIVFAEFLHDQGHHINVSLLHSKLQPTLFRIPSTALCLLFISFVHTFFPYFHNVNKQQYTVGKVKKFFFVKLHFWQF